MMTGPNVKALIASFKGRKVFFDPLCETMATSLLQWAAIKSCGNVESDWFIHPDGLISL